MSTHPRPAISAAAALDAAVQREVRIAEQTRPLRAALSQSERYTDLRGEHYPLAAMSGAEALLVLALLERHAETLHRGELGEQLLHAAEHARPRTRRSDRAPIVGSPRRARPSGCAQRRFTAR